MRRHRGRDSFKVGLAVLVVGAVITYLGVTRTNPFHRGYEVNAVFASALSNGIHSGSPVRIAGVNVGKVTGVSRTDGSTVKVTMELTQAGRPVHRDATIKARPRLFLEGNFFLELRPGTSAEPELEDGDTIPLTQTALPVQFDEFLSAFAGDTRRSFRDLLGGFSESLRKGGDEALREDFVRLPGALRYAAPTLRAMRGRRTGDLAGFVAGQARVSDALARNRRELGGFITGFRRTMEALADRQAPLRASLPAMQRLLEASPRALAAIDRALPPLRALSVALRPSLAIAPGVLDHAQPFLASLRSLMAPDRLDGLVLDLGPSVDRLRALERSLPPLLDLVRPVSDCVRTNVLPILEAKVDDGHLSTNQAVWLDLLHGLQGLLSSQQNFGGDGYGTRYSFGIDQTVVATQLAVPERLVMLSGTPLLGARPKWTPGHQPPYRPDVPCETQPLPSLEAETVGAPANQRTIRLKPEKAWTRKQLLSRLRQSYAKLERR
jgi:virulence factor Mce-like protein